MTPVFLDTSFVLALLLRDDEHHGTARLLRGRQAGPLLTTELILIEIADALAAADRRHMVSPTIRGLRNQAALRIVPATTDLLDRGLALFDSRADKEWGLTDCISFVVMRECGCAEALTADRHFQQAGFKALLRDQAFG